MANLDLEFHSPGGERTLDTESLSMTLIMENPTTITVMGIGGESLSIRGVFSPDKVKARITQLLEGSGITFTEK